MPTKRYVGAFGAVGWATRSGSGLIKAGDKLRIERAKQLPSKTFKKGKGNIIGKRPDTIVRFTNDKGEEIGRLESETAFWVAPLLDQHICQFEAHCVYSPERLRSNETIYLQLHTFLLKSLFESEDNFKPADDNRATGIYEAKETKEERDLHLRQLSVVKLFDEINLQPFETNELTQKHKRQGLLRAVEVAQRYEKNNETTTEASSTPSSDPEEGEELQEDQLDSLYKKAQSFDFNTPEYEPSSTFAMELRKYQKQALHWMIGKERDEKASNKTQTMHPLWEEYRWPSKDVDGKDIPSVDGHESFYVNPYSGQMSLKFPVQDQNCLGGLLADEMGLGKTIEMLSLIHSNKSDIWTEIASKTSGETVADINSLPRMPMASSGIQSAPCTTLVVAPMSLLAQWESEAVKASKTGTLRTLIYYGADKALNLQNLCCEANAATAPNVVITSYGIVLSEFGKIASGESDRGSYGGLFSLDYFRVILDEAHNIKNRQAKTSKACYNIAAKHRWVLTGTPIVNRLEDLFSLVHFLRVEPWSNFSFWKTFITVPFESQDHLKALNVVQTVLEPLVLRRTKDMKTPDGEALVPLPPKIVDIERLALSDAERAVYRYIFTRAKRTFAANVEAGTLMKSYTTILAQLSRLRQACNHPDLVRHKEIVSDEADADAAADVANGLADDMDLQSLIERFSVEQSEQDVNAYGAYALQQIKDEAENECPICSEEPMIEQAVTGCWHSACKKCVVDYINHQKDKGEIPRCFNCREPVNTRDVFEVVRREDLSASISLRRINQASSAKITALLSHLNVLRRNNPKAKSVVFSQWTSFLDLLEPKLNHDRIPFLRLDGRLTQKQRVAVLRDFADEDTSAKDPGMILLISLKTGGVGLNLTTAERVFMMDPWWSFAVESQAIDRVHRMGQDKEVRVIRFVCEDSIEEKMLRIQERKKFM